MNPPAAPKVEAAMADRLRTARLKAKLSQTEMARRMGWKSPTSVGNVELGKAALTVPMVKQWAVITGEDFGYLCEGAAANPRSVS